MQKIEINQGENLLHTNREEISQSAQKLLVIYIRNMTPRRDGLEKELERSTSSYQSWIVSHEKKAQESCSAAWLSASSLS